MIEYPTYKMRGHPTPNNKLVICEVCHRADWVTHTTGRSHYCCSSRTREATTQEYEQGKKTLKIII